MLRGAVVRGRKNSLHFGLPGRLRRTRKAMALSRASVARIASTADAVIKYIEEGSSFPLTETAERIALALGIAPCYLAYGTEMPLDAGRMPEPFLGPRGIATRLRLARERAGLSMRALGRASGLTVTTVSNIESGQNLPGVDTAEHLATALRVSPSWLAFGAGSPGAGPMLS